MAGPSHAAFPQGKSQITVIKITMPMHTTTDWHTHPILNGTYTVTGELIIAVKNGSDKQEFKPGPRLWTPCTTA